MNDVKKHFKSFLIIFCIVLGMNLNEASGQSIKLFAGDLLNGAVNGAALGGATMALQNSDDVAPLRVGVGLGILYGAGVGFYDNSTISKGEQFYISGTFNDGRNSTIIVLLDTFYGAAGGALIGSAISLIANDPILNGLQYGSGAGAWIGFGYGLIDAFVLAEGPDDFQASNRSANHSNHAEGIVQISARGERVNIGLLHPTLMSNKQIEGRTIKQSPAMGLEVLNVNIGL